MSAGGNSPPATLLRSPGAAMAGLLGSFFPPDVQYRNRMVRGKLPSEPVGYLVASFL
jgi:hypothetical protein